jgi:hypothetical protein
MNSRKGSGRQPPARNAETSMLFGHSSIMPVPMLELKHKAGF